jgi:hypothetical protein
MRLRRERPRITRIAPRAAYGSSRPGLNDGFTRRRGSAEGATRVRRRRAGNGDWTAEGAEGRRGVHRGPTAPCAGAGTDWGWAPLRSTPPRAGGGRGVVPCCRSCSCPPVAPLSRCHPAGARRRRASVGIYSPCRVASHQLGTVDPDTRSLRSRLRDDRFVAIGSRPSLAALADRMHRMNEEGGRRDSAARGPTGCEER